MFGVAWAASLRAYMAELAGLAGSFDWMGTFGLILVPGGIVGALLGLAEHLRRLGGRPGWRWLGAAPLLFPVAALSVPGALPRFLSTGLGGGSIGVTGLGLLLGYAVSRRGPRWARIAAGIVGVAMGAATLATAGWINPDLALTTPRGAWVAVLGVSLCLVLVWACAIAHREVPSAE